MPTHTEKERAKNKKKGPTVKKTVARKKSQLSGIMASIRGSRGAKPKAKAKSKKKT